MVKVPEIIEFGLAKWYTRIVVFALLSCIFFELYSIGGYSDLRIAILFPVLVASIIIESLRRDSHFHLFGIMLNPSSHKEFFSGTFLAIFNMLFVALVSLPFTPTIELKYIFNNAYYLFVISTFVFAFFEELVFRGVLFQSFLEYFGKYITTILFSLAFALVHYYNTDFTVIFFINLVLAGVLFSVMYIQTKSLWLSIGFHFVWNLLQVAMLGCNISGIETGINQLNMNLWQLPELLFGGDIGIEGGLICTLILIVNILLVLKYAKISPYINSLLFKRYYAESILLYNHKK
jgi:membrane protease YdiL (CAAX protease family)